jgi:hypothetical protein
MAGEGELSRIEKSLSQVEKLQERFSAQEDDMHPDNLKEVTQVDRTENLKDVNQLHQTHETNEVQNVYLPHEVASGQNIQEAMNDAQKQFLTMMEVRQVLRAAYKELSQLRGGSAPAA